MGALGPNTSNDARRLRHGTVNGPSKPQPLPGDVHRHEISDKVDSFSERHLSPCELDADRAALIALLHLPRRPPAVFWRVASIVVDPVDRQARRGPAPHVADEAFEPGLAVSTEPPGVAYEDPARAVAGEPLRSRVVTARDQ